MKINNVVGVRQGNFSRNVTFSRKLKEEEKKDYSQTVSNALKLLGIQNRALIIHGPSFPTAQSKSVEQEIGSPYSNPKFLEFAKMHGFNSIQLGPMGMLNRGDASPYTSSVFAKNPLFIDLEALQGKDYGSILSKEELSAVAPAPKATDKDHTRVDFDKAQNISKEALFTAYKNFQTRVEASDPAIRQLKEEYYSFRSNNDFWLDYYAVLDSIAQNYGTDDYNQWSEQDRELIPKVKAGDSDAIRDYNNIQRIKADEIGAYKFSQFLIDKQSKEKAPEDMVFTGDLLVGASHFDELVYNEAFLKDYKIGAQWGGICNSPQLWGISILDPNKLFNEDGSYGPAGEFLHQKLKRAMAGAKNIRIDHVIGLVNPYVYKQDSVVYKEERLNGETVKVPSRDDLQANYLSQLGIDKNGNFQRVLKEIVIRTMYEMGIDPQQVVWEDLGNDPTGVFDRVFRGEGLHGISGMLWTRGENVPRDNWAYVGCHDNPPAGELIKDRNTVRERWEGGWDEAWNAGYLAHRVKSTTVSEEEKAKYRNRLENDPKELVKAKWVDLLRSSKNIQVSFMDFFGIQKPYNIPGTSNDENWTLRLPSDYEDKYHKSLEEDGWAINMPEILDEALVAKTQDEINAGKSQDKAWAEVSGTLNKLRHYNSVLKEKE